MEHGIDEVARLTGTTSRTLRHYDAIGLLPPTSVGANGYRRYDERALVRLQRILVLRELGLGLARIAEALEGEPDAALALRGHLAVLREEKGRLTRRIAAVEDTITRLEEGRGLVAEEMFDGFDHTEHREEVEERWGREAYAASDRWWTGMTDAERDAWKERTARLGSDWAAAAERGVDPASDEAGELAARHVAWLGAIPVTPGAEDGGPSPAYVLGLADMYVQDERFAANYGGTRGARFVRDALRVFVERERAS